MDEYPQWINEIKDEHSRDETKGSYYRAFIEPGLKKVDHGSERLLHKRLALWLKEDYPDVRFHTSLDGERLAGDAQAYNVSVLQWGKGFPDLIIYAARGPFCGLALELKKESPFRKDGKLKKSDHLVIQQGWLDYLKQNHWQAQFAWDVNAAKIIISSYLNILL